MTRVAPGSAAIVTTDLTVPELLLVHEAGYEPLGMVLGSSVFHVSKWSNPPTVTRELTYVSGGLARARTQAVARLVTEVSALGGHGAVGVRVTTQQHELGSGVYETLAVGTAVRSSAAPRAGRPFTSDLTGQDFWLLRRSGWMPVALLSGTVVMHLGHLNPFMAAAVVGKNEEMDDWTEAMTTARETAVLRMQKQATGLGAQGVVDVRLEQLPTLFGRRVVEFRATGTAVRPVPVPQPLPTPGVVLTL